MKEEEEEGEKHSQNGKGKVSVESEALKANHVKMVFILFTEPFKELPILHPKNW